MIFLDCQRYIGGNLNIHCVSCTINGYNKCDPAGCPTHYKKGTVYNNITKQCETCQERIGGYSDIHCKYCQTNGGGKCDETECRNIDNIFTAYGAVIGVIYNTRTLMCETCQDNIGGKAHLKCVSCQVNGAGRCDPTGCPNNKNNDYRHITTLYNYKTNMCEVCQKTIGGYIALNCILCEINGGGKCDLNGCPTDISTHVWYNSKTEKCEMCQNKIPGGMGIQEIMIHCNTCNINGDGKCDPDGCPTHYFTSDDIKIGIVYSNTSKMCLTCQVDIGHNEYCTKCSINGPGNCDPDGCFAEYTNGKITKYLPYNNVTKKCENCQDSVKSDFTDFHPKLIECRSCIINGGNKCDADACPHDYIVNRYDRQYGIRKGVAYHSESKICKYCQYNIEGIDDLNCMSCSINGAGLCDEAGCPGLTYYNNKTQLCQKLESHKPCRSKLLQVKNTVYESIHYYHLP